MSVKAQPADESGCSWPSKVAYPTWEAAEAAIRQIGDRGKFVEDMAPYRCNKTGHFHIGHSIRKFEARIKRSLRRGR